MGAHASADVPERAPSFAPGFLGWLRLRAMAGVLVMTICCLKVLRSPGNPARALTVLPLVLLPADFALRVSNRWSTGELMDRTLLQLCLTSPISNLLAMAVVPGFDVMRISWRSLLIFQTLFGTISVSLAPMHAIIHVTACAICCGYHELCQMHQLRMQAAGGSGQDSQVQLLAFLVRFLFLHWLPMCFLALVVAVIGGASTQPRQAEGAEQQPPPPVPLESLGVHLFERLRLKGALQRYHAFVAWVALATAKVNLLALMCMVVTMYHGITLILARGDGPLVLPSARMSSESLLVALATTCTFIVGRESNRMDMRVVMEVVQSQLAASHSLLMDQLPAHIVKAVLSKMSSSPATPVAAAGASAAAQAQPQPPMRSQSQYGRLRRRSSAFQPATVALGADSDAVHMSDASLSSGSCAYNRWQRQQSLTVSGGSADRADSRELEVASMVSVSRLSSGSPALDNNDAAVAVAAALERPASASALRIRVTQPLRSSSSPAGNGAGNDGDVQRSGLHDGQDDRCGAAPRWQSSTTLQTITPTRLPSGSGAAGEGRHGTSSPGMRIEPLTAQSPGKPLQRKSLSTHMHRLCAALNGSHLTWLSGPPPSSPRHGVDGTYPKGDGAAASSGPEAGQLLEQVQRQDSSCPPDSDDLLASNHDSVTLFVSDIVSFSSWAGKVEPTKVLHTINELYSRLDSVILEEFPSLYKIETIGDAYIVAANLLVPDPNHAATAVRFAVRAQEEAAQVARPDVDDGSTLQMRIGLHSGSISSGIVGKIRRRFVVYGEAMNLASRTETTCPPGCIQLTAATQELAAPALEGCISLVHRGEVHVKGREQPLVMYLVNDDWGDTLKIGEEAADYRAI